MNVPRLLDLCVRRVIYYIFADTLPPTSCQLNPDLSNRLFEEYCENFDAKVTRKMMKDVCSILNVTKMDFTNSGPNRKELLLLRNMNLVSLALGSLTHLGPNKTDSHEPLKLDAMLKFCLNKTTLQQLQHLDLSLTDIKYLDGWVESISKLLPSLISFSVSGRQLSLPEFRAICTYFPNLRSLDISDTGLTSLEGISNLTNIEILAIGGLRDLTSSGMIEIFELKKIRVLSLSSKRIFGHIRLFKRFLLCDKVLPELRSIDLSGTSVEFHLLESLLKTHPTIEQIGMLSTRYSQLPAAFHDVQILSCQNLTALTESLKHYSSLKDYSSVNYVLHRAEDQKEMFENLDICRDLVESLNFFYRTKQFKKYQFVLKFIIKMVEYHPENFVKVGGVNIFVRHLIRYSQVESLKMLKLLALTGNSEFIRELSTPENVRGFVHYLQKCKPKLNYFTNVNSLSEKTFLVCCILSVIVYSIDEKRFNSMYWKNIVKLLKEVLTTLAEEPRYPCVHLEEVFETYFEKRTMDVKQGAIQDIQCHRDEKGACFYC
ncbi:hypothetical protein GCK72_020159 [Caenorhabditis remanei]|uniref:Uncharacterized protein n=1 Tax=Caenorhabditis remanei TaxID=31234 RepID=A0A6A5GGH9_CAERE|nr:hypothetical protein GCK72_020159 [Caenorhabditis remanei]KAF1753602.1 hypothetical protein GCK72_020159 [Caenorhabditis remanei]